MHLTSLSFAHPAVPAERRAPLFVSEDLIYPAHQRLRSQGHQAFLLSTCLRVEIAWVAEGLPSGEVLGLLYGDDSMSTLANQRVGEAAFAHLSRVAAGLESPLVGETEVLSQFRAAVSRLQSVHGGDGDLVRVLEAAVGIGRTTRRLLGDAPRGSLGRLAATVAAGHGPVAILGSGAMARAAAEHLDGAKVTVFARRAVEIGGRASVSWDLVPDALASSAVVISTIPGDGPMFSDEVARRARDSSREPLLLIDLGMPPAFRRPHASTGVRYLGVDEIASSIGHRPALEVNERVSRAAAAVWHRLCAPERVGAVIAALIEQADATVAEEVQRFAARLATASDPEQIMQQLAHSVARRVLHRPISYVASSERGADVAQTLAEAFGVADGD